MSPEASIDVTALQKLVNQSTGTSKFNTEIVRTAWHSLQRRRREANRAARKASVDYEAEIVEDPLAYCYIEQLWTDHLIARYEDDQTGYIRIPYTVESPGTNASDVKFGAPEKVRVEYVAATSGEDALAQIMEWRLANTPPQFLNKKKDSGSGGKPSGSQTKREGGNGGNGTGSQNAQPKIKSLAELDSAIKAFGQAKDKAKYKGQLLSAARKLNASEGVIKRIQALSAPSGSGSGSDSKKSPNFPSSGNRNGSVAASAVNSLNDIVELARVRTMEGARRYRKPIGTQLGTGAPGGDALATVARAGSNDGSGATADKLRKSIKNVSKEKTYKGGRVFGDIGNEGKLKSALNQIERLPGGKRGEAAAEVVKAAQALGLTSLVPTSVKRLYRDWIAQNRSGAGTPKPQPGKPQPVKAKK